MNIFGNLTDSLEELLDFVAGSLERGMISCPMGCCINFALFVESWYRVTHQEYLQLTLL